MECKVTTELRLDVGTLIFWETSGPACKISGHPITFFFFKQTWYIYIQIRKTKAQSLIDEKKTRLDKWISGLRSGSFFTDE